MIACVDAHYSESTSRMALVLFESWTDSESAGEFVEERDSPTEAYVAGEFYRRELSGILAIVRPHLEAIDILVVDGYVWLGEDRPGLGAKVHDALEGRVAVIGVAKSRFAGAGGIEVMRGKSERRLFVTAIGIAENEAAELVRIMHGEHRIPTMLKRADYLARHGA